MLLEVYNISSPSIDSSEQSAVLILSLLVAALTEILNVATIVVHIFVGVVSLWMVYAVPVLPGSSIIVVIGTLVGFSAPEAAVTKAVDIITWHEGSGYCGSFIRVVIASLVR